MPKNRNASPTPRTALRFFNEEDFNLVRNAAVLSRLSINRWMMRVCLAAAHREVKNAEAGKLSF
jgi:uncharacterized protein (DUF1778 family)